MPGPAPKPKDQRRNRHAPRAGEWVEIREPAKPVLGGLPKRDRAEGAWSARTKRAWAAWGSDPAATMWTRAEHQLVVDLAYTYEAWVRSGASSGAAEVRQRQDILGLSPKGKQDRRWRVVREKESEAERPLAEVRRLKVVGA